MQFYVRILKSGIRIRPSDRIVVVKKENLLLRLRRSDELNLHFAVALMLISNFSAGVFGVLAGTVNPNHSLISFRDGITIL